MCGIAGFFGTMELEENRLGDCLKLMRRRGPDHASSYTHRRPDGRFFHLIHTRLAIIDLDKRANQPFRSGTKVFAVNGELYNYVELREELKGSGCEFLTQSDTEVFVKLLDRCGEAALDRCEGMWAFALYDELDGSLLLSRDRFGEKPLYIHEGPEGLYFGSEIKYILALKGRPLEINEAHLTRYLVNGYKSLFKVNEDFFKEVRSIAPATAVRFNAPGSGGRVRKYWDPPVQVQTEVAYEEAVDRVRQLMIESVQLRLRADRPIAFCMSGGVDSNSLIGIARNVFGYDVHGFTVENADPRYEEKELVDHAVKEFRIRHTAVPVTTDRFIPRLRDLIFQHDGPVYTITYYAHWLLMAKVADCGYRISVSGTGADELFSGYYDHHNAYLYEVSAGKSLYEPALEGWKRNVKPWVRNPFLQNPNLFIEDPSSRDHIYLSSREFSSFLYSEWSEPFTEVRYAAGLLRNRMLNEMFHETVPPVLHEDDLNAMYYSIENRSPYLDRQLFEYCYTVPTRHLIRRGFAKAILRDAMRGLVPDRVLDNPRKVGFNAPISSFLDVGDRRVREYLLDKSPVYRYVRRDKIEKLIEKPELQNSQSKFLFYFLNCKIFLEEFGN